MFKNKEKRRERSAAKSTPPETLQQGEILASPVSGHHLALMHDDGQIRQPQDYTQSVTNPWVGGGGGRKNPSRSPK